jgi:hypothetical protein
MKTPDQLRGGLIAVMGTMGLRQERAIRTNLKRLLEAREEERSGA